MVQMPDATCGTAPPKCLLAFQPLHLSISPPVPCPSHRQSRFPAAAVCCPFHFAPLRLHPPADPARVDHQPLQLSNMLTKQDVPSTTMAIMPLIRPMPALHQA
ncbi:hypothetical protein M011DRAFT_470029 [Sporormia fimetaria CBS 119925]|uniref:Uncharacterized protein n=1 Tax=Sporormia fimetaria CBS 119925 TaxID=1340428 RepID=A0A6A6V4M7_9PLEO|nr:hypothetical protein M011DRAFT_470029 [Sporormia fimetaria CBS 119925]